MAIVQSNRVISGASKARGGGVIRTEGILLHPGPECLRDRAWGIRGRGRAREWGERADRRAGRGAVRVGAEVGRYCVRSLLADFLHQRKRFVILLCLVETQQLCVRELCGKSFATAVFSGKQGCIDLVTVCYRLYELNEGRLFRQRFWFNIPSDCAASESTRGLSTGVR